MASPANSMDYLISLALSSQAAVTKRRKQAAWERLQAEASNQVMLVPYAVPPRPVGPPVHWSVRLTKNIRRGLTILLTDDALYHRAAYTRQYDRPYGFGADHVLSFYPNSLIRYHAC